MVEIRAIPFVFFALLFCMCVCARVWCVCICVFFVTKQRELMAMVKFGADEILRMDDSHGLTDESIDELLRKGEEKTEETNARIQKDMQASSSLVFYFYFFYSKLVWLCVCVVRMFVFFNHSINGLFYSIK